MILRSLHIALSLVASLLFSQLAFSHGGGLNSEGCHNEKSTGAYHCHKLNNSTNNSVKYTSYQGYSRSAFNYRSYAISSRIGYYTNVICTSIDLDHVVSLHDAYKSGAHAWSSSQKSVFANDRENHVPSCDKVNRSKGSTGPKDFLRLSQDGKGFDFKIVNFCEYVQKYHRIKVKYGLSLASNHKQTFADCGVNI